jgi:hypothetical protein
VALLDADLRPPGRDLGPDKGVGCHLVAIDKELKGNPFAGSAVSGSSISAALHWSWETTLIGGTDRNPLPQKGVSTVKGVNSDSDVRGDIRQFLMSRRARITPEQAGLPNYGSRRRVPGLRREEVALLAGISIEYYTLSEVTPVVSLTRSSTAWVGFSSPTKSSTHT